MKLKTVDLVEPARIHLGHAAHVSILDVLAACQDEDDFSLIEYLHRGWSQAEIAEDFGVSQPTVSRRLRSIVTRAIR